MTIRSRWLSINWGGGGGRGPLCGYPCNESPTEVHIRAPDA